VSRWLRRLTKLHHYSYPVIAIFGVVTTVVLARPGESWLALGPVRVDAFYVSVVAFGVLLVLSVTGTYDPAEYGLEDDTDTDTE
jgi:hypothetical protein